MRKPNFGCLGTRTCILSCMAGAIITTIHSAISVFSLSTRATRLIFRRKFLLQTRTGSNLHRKRSSRFGLSERSNRPQHKGRFAVRTARAWYAPMAAGGDGSGSTGSSDVPDGMGAEVFPQIHPVLFRN